VTDSANEGSLPLRLRIADKWIMYLILGVTCLVFLFPLINAFQASIQVGGLMNYWTVLTRDYNGVSIPLTFLNSGIIAAMHAAIVCVVGSLAGYAFSRIPFVGRTATYYLVLIFLAVPATAILVPVYHITSSMQLFNSYLGVAMPEATLTLPFAVLLLKNQIDAMPVSLMEAAVMDRAGHFRIYFHVVLPLLRGPLVSLAALSIMWSLQDFLFPATLLRDVSLTTAAQAVQTIKGAFGPTAYENSLYYAALMLLAVPALIIIVGGFKYISRGMTNGSIKE
jgi:ABC-type glycerol-3-phosphate transport system permease component